MKFTIPVLLTTMLSIGLLAIVGCSEDSTTSNSPASPSTSAEWKTGLDDAVVAELSKLPDADREAALQQKVCPVTGKQLGSMGMPPKVTVNGQDLFLCCNGCESEIKSNPEKYLAKLNAAQ